MEKKNKNQISTVLLIVGAIFIMIAGSIFVTRAWGYLSEAGKRLILTGIVAGLYVASWKLREKGILTKTEHALYYLATAGTGFITVSFLGGWSLADGYLNNGVVIEGFNNADRAMWGLFAAAIGIAYRFFKERRAWDFGILSFIFTCMFFLVFEGSVIDMAGVLPLIGLTLLSTFQYVNTNHTGYRIAQSIGLVAVNYFFIYELYELVYGGITISYDTTDLWWCFTALAIDLVMMVVLNRKELIWMTVSYNWLMTLVQILEGFAEWDKAESHIYNIVPFALATSISFLVMWYRENDTRYRNIAIIHGFMVVLDLVMYVIDKEWLFDISTWDDLALGAMCTCVMIALIFGMVDSMIVNDTAKRIMKTFALLFSEFAALFLTIVIAPEDFGVELMSIFFGVGIFLLGRIWNDRIGGARVAQFILTCLTLFVLLLHNIAVEELANLMLLGITGIVMLIVAAIMNRREYVIASSVTLSLLALYLTREFWLSIEWWVYLFAAGVVLVGIAIRKEREM